VHSLSVECFSPKIKTLDKPYFIRYNATMKTKHDAEQYCDKCDKEISKEYMSVTINLEKMNGDEIQVLDEELMATFCKSCWLSLNMENKIAAAVCDFDK
jgi:hypothetical protein